MKVNESSDSPSGSSDTNSSDSSSRGNSNGSSNTESEEKTIFVVGSDDYNLNLIKRAPGTEKWNLVSALHWEDVQPPSGRIDFNALYRKARHIIEDYGKRPDAIIGYLDFPVSSLVSLLNRKYQLPGATPEAVACCEHKYWMRLVQSRCLPNRTPRFTAINPFKPDAALRDMPPFPFWLKPVKGHSSVLGFLVRDKSDLENALHAFRQKIHFFGEPFNDFLGHLDDITEINGTDGNFAIAESLISGPRQFTLEAYMWEGEMTVYGAIDSVRSGMYSSSFSMYRYPAQLPDAVVKEAGKLAAKLLTEIGFDNSAFNVEFFWDPTSDALNLLEINPRISKSHGPLFHMVDGATHHKLAIDLALGNKPELPQGKGDAALASKFMLRSFEADGVVRRVPSQEELETLRHILPDMEANILVEENTQLSSLFYQDSYSFELAEIFLGGCSKQMIDDIYVRCCDSLEFHIQPMPKRSV